ncbi:MAG: asparaginase [Burkholderiaceae bacterium]
MPSLGRPRIVVLGMGGTIAATAAIGLKYQSGRRTVDQVLSGLPDISDWAAITTEQIASVGSQSIDYGNWAALCQRIQDLAAGGQIDGIVVTHGTDTLEETAYFLWLTLQSKMPIVLTGAMRAPNALGADGIANLYHAIAVAASADAGGRGVLVVMNEQIHSARDVQKMASSGLDAFASPNRGPVGRVSGRTVGFFEAPRDLACIKLSAINKARPPCVFVLYSHGDLSLALVEAMLALKPDGIILAGVGNGNTTDAVLQALAGAAVHGVAIVRASRTGRGAVLRNIEVDDDHLGFIAAQDLNPQKARILLMLALRQTRDAGVIHSYFMHL